MKEYICAVVACIGSVIAGLFGGWDKCMGTFFIFMGIDYLTGVIVASVFHNSPKSANGTLESRAGWKGLCRKFITLIFVLIGNRLDLIFGSNYIRDVVCIFFIANELVSIVENAGLMGVPIPPAITESIEVLRERTEDKPTANTAPEENIDK